MSNSCIFYKTFILLFFSFFIFACSKDTPPIATQSTISFEKGGITATEGTIFIYTLRLTNTSSTDVTFAWSVEHRTTLASDFIGNLAGTKQIAAGSTATDITIYTSDDTISESTESFSLSITSITGASPSNLSARGSILDNDSIATVVDSNANGLIDITTKEQLGNIRYNLAGTSYKTSASDVGVACEGAVCRGYELLANIALSTNWQPIGSTSDSFRSRLQGNGYSITNLDINGEDHLGLFAALAGATIDNLIVEVASISGDSYVGALAGSAKNSHFANVEIRAASTSSKLSATGIHIGGMLGEIIDTTIINATSDLSIVVTGSVVGESMLNSVGGIVGYVASSVISYAYSSSSVFASDGINAVGGLVGYVLNNSTISNSSASGSVTSSGANSDLYGGLVGYIIQNSKISYSSASASVTSSGVSSDAYGGLVGFVTSSDISHSSASGSVTSSGANSDLYGGLVGLILDATISYSSASGSVSSSGASSDQYGGLVGFLITNSDLSHSSASGSVTSSGANSAQYGGLVGLIFDATISYSSASGSVTSSGANSDQYGGLVGLIFDATISYSSASGSVTSSGANSDDYGGLVGVSYGDIRHSWSSSSVFASNPAGLVGNNGGNLEFSYALGVASYGLVATNTGTIKNSYWNSETSGALVAADGTYNTINIDYSDTVGMLAATGSTSARIFKGFAAATAEDHSNIWSFADDSYPVITALGLDKQAVALAYGLLRLANPNVGVSTLDSFLGSTLNHEAIALDANSYNANEPLAILDVNLLQSNSATCAAGSGDIIMTTTGANGTRIALQKIAGSTEVTKQAGNSCEIILLNQPSGTLQLAAVISKGAASLTKKFDITLKNTQPTISLQPTTLSTREGGTLVFTLELNHRTNTDVTFAWSVEHRTTLASDFIGVISGRLETISAGDTIATISIYTSDDTISESTESFSLSITNITGATPSNLSARGSILDNDSIATVVDSNANGLIDLVTQEQLGNIRYNLAGTSYKTSASDVGAACEGGVCRGYELLANIALSTNWQPIGSTSDSFRSRLQGNGYSITNLDINGEDYLGLFAALAGATIDNLIVEVASISGDSYVGALAGSAKNSHFTNVEIRAASTSSKLSATGINIGGMLGEIIDTTITNATSDLSIVVAGNNVGEIIFNGVGGIVGSVFSSSISYAYSSGSVFASGGVSIVGGLVGLIFDATISYSSASGSVSSRGTFNLAYGGLAGSVENAEINNSSASGSVTSSGGTNFSYGGLAGAIYNSKISDSIASGSVIGNGSSISYYGGLVGDMRSNSTISYSSASGSVTSSGDDNIIYGGLVGGMDNSTISYSSASASVTSSGDNNDQYGGLVGIMENNSTISYSNASGSVSSSGASSNKYGGLVGLILDATIDYSSASGSVTSSGANSDDYGGLVGSILDATISYSSASGSVTSSGANSDDYGGLVGKMDNNSTISYSSASGSVTSSGANSDDYGGLVGVSYGDIRHSWSSSSVFASNPAGLVGNNGGNLEFSYALGVASYGLVATNTGTIKNSYWNSETSGALVAADGTYNTINIDYSDTVGMLAATGSTSARIFKGFAAATAEDHSNIWNFADGRYPIITQLGIDEQAVALAYGLLRLASPNVGVSTLDSFLGSTLNHEAIALDANSYNANEPLAILDVNLLQSNSVACAAGSGDTILTTTGANGTRIALQKIAGSTEVTKQAGNSCEIILLNQPSGTLQLAAVISKGAASLTKKFDITLKNTQPTISLQPTTLSTREGGTLVFTLELNHRTNTDVTFAWSVEHNTTLASDFIGNLAGTKQIAAGSTATDITIYTSDDTISESTESFSLSITNITGATPSNLSARGSILDNDSIATVVDSNANGLIDLVTQEQLQNMRYNLAGTSYKTSASDVGAACEGGVCRGYELLANIALSTNWQPIGSTSDSFRSRLQGNGYSITNLDINGEDYLGLFAALAGATIDNLIVEVASIAGDSYVGALAGSAKNSHFTNVEIRAASTSSKLSATGINIGGMLGEIIDTTIINATSDLSIVVAGNNVGEFIFNGVGGIVGSVLSSSISYAYSSGSVFASGGVSIVGGLVGYISTNSDLSYSSASGSVSSRGTRSDYYGGLVGLIFDATISNSSASGSVSSSEASSDYYGGLVGLIFDATISYSSASGSVTSKGNNNDFYGGLAGGVDRNSQVSYSSASGSVTSSGSRNFYYGGLVGDVGRHSAISYSSASGSVTSSGDDNDQYGGLVGSLDESTIDYSSASGSVTSSGANNDAYGGLVGVSHGDIRHSWSSSSVFASNPAGLVDNNGGNLEFSYALGVVLQNTAPVTSGFGLVATNIATASITNSYWNSETSGALVAADGTYNTINIDYSDTASMLASTGSTSARIFKGFAAATAEDHSNIWNFASGNYPVITALGLDKQAVALAYGLLRLASPNVGVSTLDSFLGSTLNHEAIALDANSYNANEPLAILDVNLLQSNSATCAAGSGDIIMTTTGANGTRIALQKIAGSTEVTKQAGNSCEIILLNQPSGTLQLAAVISKGAASLTKKFDITLKNTQPTISLQPTTLSTREGGTLVFTLELNHKTNTDVTFAWSVEHNTTLASDFIGNLAGTKQIAAGSTATDITIYTSDDTISESTESFSLSITSITGATPSNLSARGSILDNDSIATVVDSNANGLIDLVTQEQLQNMRYNLAGTSYKTSASDAGAACEGGVCRGYELLANIALSTNWQPIGSTSDSFRSRLQGNGYSITNLDINGENYLGLFAALAGATIDNLIVEVASIAGDSYVGALAGIAVNSHFTNVEIRAASTSSKLSATGIHIGGMLGAIIDTTIINATSDLSIVVAGNNVGESMLNSVGGIVGSVLSSSISYAYSSGSVFASGGVSIVGGLVGWLNASSDLSYSSTSGSVSSRGTNNSAYGGLVGYVLNNSRISNSSTSGSVTSSGDNNFSYGGLVGYMNASSDLSYSSASGSVSSSSGDNRQYGGLVGGIEDNSKISYSSASGSVSSSSGDNNGSYGGLVGAMYHNSAISYSSANGSVSSSSGDNNGSYGGLVGAMYHNSAISDSSASGSVSSRGSNGAYGGNYNYGGLVGRMLYSAISYSSASGSVSSRGDYDGSYGGLVGSMSVSSDLSYSSASGNVSSRSSRGDSAYFGTYNYGGLVGNMQHNSAISDSSASGSVISSGANSNSYGGLVGNVEDNSTISNSIARGSVTSSGDSNDDYGGLVGNMDNNSTISNSIARGSVTSRGDNNDDYGGLVGDINRSTIYTISYSRDRLSISGRSELAEAGENSTISYSSASGSISSRGDYNDWYGGLVGSMSASSDLSYSSASGSVTSSGASNDYYGGLVGFSAGEVQHSWSSSSVFASNPAGLVGNNGGNLEFSYALGDASYGLVATNRGTIKNSYWNSETSGALAATTADVVGTNIASSDTAGMLASTGSTSARIFKGFAAATDELGNSIWSFASDSYPVITQLGLDKQAVALAYGLLRLANPNVGGSTLDSFLGSTLNHEAIALDAINYNANEPLAILDVNLLQSNSATCAAGSGDIIMTTTGANQAVVTLSITAATNNLHTLIFDTDCSINFDGAAVFQAGDRLQLAATITKGSASLTKNFVINFQ